MTAESPPGPGRASARTTVRRLGPRARARPPAPPPTRATDRVRAGLRPAACPPAQRREEGSRARESSDSPRPRRQELGRDRAGGPSTRRRALPPAFRSRRRRRTRSGPFESALSTRKSEDEDAGQFGGVERAVDDRDLGAARLEIRARREPPVGRGRERAGSGPPSTKPGKSSAPPTIATTRAARKTAGRSSRQLLLEAREAHAATSARRRSSRPVHQDVEPEAAPASSGRRARRAARASSSSGRRRPRRRRRREPPPERLEGSREVARVEPLLDARLPRAGSRAAAPARPSARQSRRADRADPARRRAPNQRQTEAARNAERRPDRQRGDLHREHDVSANRPRPCSRRDPAHERRARARSSIR